MRDRLRRMLRHLRDTAPHRAPAAPPALLGDAPVGYTGRIVALDAAATAGLPAPEVERRLLELGFVEGALVAVLHAGPFGGDPIAVRVNEATVALRRREAGAIRVVAVAPEPAA